MSLDKNLKLNEEKPGYMNYLDFVLAKYHLNGTFAGYE